MTGNCRVGASPLTSVSPEGISSINGADGGWATGPGPSFGCSKRVPGAWLTPI